MATEIKYPTSGILVPLWHLNMSLYNMEMVTPES